MNTVIKVGDLVETCSLMPGVVMKLQGSDIEARMLDVDEYSGNNYACCSLNHCGIVKLTAAQALERLKLGKEKLTEIWKSMDNCADNDIGEEYFRRVTLAASKL